MVLLANSSLMVMMAATLREFISTANSDAMNRDRDLAASVNITQTSLSIPARDGGRYINATLYHPPSFSTNTTQKLPILVNWHGSGWVAPALSSDAYFLKRVADECNIFALDADYRKAPEDPFPAALNDVEDILASLAKPGSDNPHQLYLQQLVDIKQVVVSGFSSGAELALVVSSVLRTGPLLKNLGIDIKAVVPFYPETDLTLSLDKKKVPNPIAPMPNWMLDFFHDAYVPNVSVRADPSVSPSKADLEMFPDNVVMVTGEGDNMEPEASELAGRLKNSSRTRVVNVSKLGGVGHGFDKGCQNGTIEWQRREEAYEFVIESLNGVFKGE